MIETSLIRLSEAVQKGQKLSYGAKVLLPMGDEAEIYGFIAIDLNISSEITMPPLGECQVFANRVIFSLDNETLPFPIFSSVSKASEERYGLYLLYIPKFSNLSKSQRQSYRWSLNNEKPHASVGQINGVKIDDNIAYYYPTENELYFESRTRLRSIGSDFAVIIRVSKISDDIKYELFDSYSVRIEQS